MADTADAEPQSGGLEPQDRNVVYCGSELYPPPRLIQARRSDIDQPGIASTVCTLPPEVWINFPTWF